MFCLRTRLCTSPMTTVHVGQRGLEIELEWQDVMWVLGNLFLYKAANALAIEPDISSVPTYIICILSMIMK